MPFHDSIGDALGIGSNNGGGGIGDLGFLGTVIGAGVSLGGAELSRQFASDEAQKQRKFVGKLSDTAYQRATADMRLAGLNPILAYQQGGASTPSGSMANVPDFGAAMARGAEAGSSAVKRGVDNALTREQKKVATSAKDLNAQKTVQSIQDTETARLQGEVYKGRFAEYARTNRILMPEVAAADQELRFNKSPVGKEFHFYSQLGSAALKTGGLISQFIPKFGTQAAAAKSASDRTAEIMLKHRLNR